MPLEPQIFTPEGGMNQDDALTTPSKDSAGRNAFDLGDYRYASNVRIGSSRTDNFGDVENLRSTAEVTSYFVKQQLFTNPNFDGTLSPWLQLDDGPGHTAWTWATYASNDYAVFSVPTTGTPFTSQVLYQTGLTLGSTVTINISKPFLILVPLVGTINIVFLSGTSILSEVEYQPTAFISDFIDTLDVPDGCDGIGVRITGTTDFVPVLGFGWQINFFNAFTLTPGSPPSGTEKTIGRYEDREALKYYYCNWNSYGNHTIRVYDYSEDAVYELLKWDFNWLETTFVKMAKLDNWMVLTDRRNNPRLFDVETITDLYLGLGSDFREFHISFHKWAPSAPPIPRIFYDNVTNNYEKLKNKNFQFSYRYVYKGNLKSRFSPISKAVPTGNLGNYYAANTITSIDVYIPGSLLDDPGADVAYNYFGHDDIKFTAAVDYIEIAYREGELDIWKIWKRVLSPFSTSYYFDGSFDGRPVNIPDFNQPFDTVPFLAGTVEAIDNRFVFGDCLDEQEPVLGFTIEDPAMVTDPIADWDDSSPSSFSHISVTIRNKLLRFNALSAFNLKSRGLYKIGFQFLHPTGWRSAIYTDDAMTFEIPETGQFRLNAFVFNIPSTITPPEWATSYQVVRTNVLNIDYFMFGQANKFIPLLDSANALIGLSGLPQNIKDKLNEHFENSKIVDGYQVAAEIDKFKNLPKGQQSLLSKGLFGADIGEFISKSQSSQTGSPLERTQSLNKYLRFNSIWNIIGPEVRTSAQDIIANSSRIFIDINNWYNAAKQTATKDRPLSKLYYNFRQGDRVRFYGSTVSNPTSGQIVLYDVEILEFTGTGLIVEKPEGLLSIPTETSPWQTSKFDIEVYTPKVPNNPDDYLFYETGEWYPILYPGTDSRDFSKRDWQYTSNPAVTVVSYGPFDVFSKMPFFFGDCFKISKTTYRDLSIFSSGVGTSMNPDPAKTFDLWDSSNGRPYPSYLDLPIKKFITTRARFGGKIVEESSINAVNRFQEADQFTYPSEYGRIRDLVNTANAQVDSVGAILLAIGERETWSIYVNRTTLEDLSGRTQVALSNRVLGSFNILLGGHGTLNPESVSSEGGRVWFWNAIKGCWVRYGRNGLTEISKYKMRNWFRQLSGLLASKYATDELPRVICEFDDFNDELVTFINHSTLPETFRGYGNYKGSMFSETDVRWKACHSYEPEFFGKIGTLLLAFKGGVLYKLEQEDNEHNVFFGDKYDSLIEPVFTGISVKSWQAIAITATDCWSVERILSEYRGTKSKQESRLLLASFENREDNWYSEIKNDLNTPNVTNPIINGQKMRSRALQVLMKLDPDVTTLSLLQYVTINPIDSPKNP